MNGESKCIDCGWIVRTSTIVESLCGHTLMPKRRQGMMPITIELIIFLKMNRDLWDLEDVIQANRNRQKADKESRAEKKTEEDQQLVKLLQEFELEASSNN